MMNFLPQIYEDELLYSIMARYKQMCGMISKRAFIKDLFNEEIILKSINFPQYIDLLVSNFPTNSKISSEFIIRNNTMFPMYTSFLSESKSDDVYRAMATGGIRSVANMIGVAGSKVKASKYLKYCPDCFREDITEIGESYWRRIHQVPGVLYCQKHEVLLRDSKVLNTDSMLDYCCLDEDTCSYAEENSIYNNEFKDLNLKYVENVKRLLNKEYPRKELSFIRGFYIDRLREKGLASKNGSIYMQELLKGFTDYYPVEYLELMQSSIDVGKNTNWLRLFVRDSNFNKSPVRHLLFMQYLDINIEDLFFSNNVTGKVKTHREMVPAFNVNERRAMWLKIIEDNPNVTRNELKNIGKGLHTWIYRHDKQWYEKVTPRLKATNKKAKVIDWNKRDEECLKLSKDAVKRILGYDGKPVRILREAIRREIGLGRWYNNIQLKETHKYIEEVREDLTNYRRRKIKWAINEMIQQGQGITAYKVQVYCGFGGDSKEARLLIEEVLEDI